MMSSKRSSRFFDLFDQPPENPKPTSSFKRSGQQDRALKKLQHHVDHRLDFHGQTVQEATATLGEHLKNHPEEHVCLLIHGKAYATGSKLKHALLHHLTQHPRCYAYKSSPPSMGGDGASLARFTKNR